METKAVVLLSGGLDSTVNLYSAFKEWGDVLALSFHYGQKAFPQELKAATYFCGELGIPHKLMDLREIFSWDQSSLTQLGKDVPTDSVDIESESASKESAAAVWVSNRNGVFLNIAACVAESLKASFIVPGFNKEEAATFPDNSVDFIDATNRALSFSTANRVEVRCFTQKMDKEKIVQEALKLEIPLAKIWPCYHAGESRCGRCESCQRFERALKKVGVSL